jgi:hypothetical protein
MYPGRNYQSYIGDTVSSGVVRSGFRPHSDRMAQAFAIEVLRDQHQDMARKFVKLRAAVLDWMESKGKENEKEYLVRLEYEVGRHR